MECGTTVAVISIYACGEMTVLWVKMIALILV
jgi:hypothetical protein